MNNTLYEITDKYLKVLDNLEIDEETGEILNAEELDELSGAFEEKSEAVACYIKNSEVFIGDLKAEEANLAKRRKQTEKRIDYLKNVLTACPVCGGPISEAERRYSMNKFGREMCRACQKNA